MDGALLMGARIIITCPEWWSDDQAVALADRLLADALPSTVGIYVDAQYAVRREPSRAPTEEA
jgi:hypothetical protein